MSIRVEQILRESNALLEGHFLLTSGRHAGKYMQCAQILQYPEFSGELADILAKEFANDNVDFVVGPAMGGIIIAYELARKLGTKSMFAERENKVMTLRRGFVIPNGARVVVAEDVVTTGGSVKEVIDLVKAHGAYVCGVAVLVDRSNGTIDFGTKFCAAYTTEIVSYEENDCPLCKEGSTPLVKPGSRAK